MFYVRKGRDNDGLFRYLYNQGIKVSIHGKYLTCFRDLRYLVDGNNQCYLEYQPKHLFS